MQIFCYIPSACLGDGELAGQVRAKVQQALELHLAPAKLPHGVTSSPVRMDDGQMPQIQALAKSHNLAPGRVVGGLIYALHLAHAQQESQTLANAMALPNLKGLRPGQVRCMSEAAARLRAGNIIAAECGTGSGKSRLIAHAAAYLVALRNAGESPALPPRPDTTYFGSAEKAVDDVSKLPVFMMAFAAKAWDVYQDRAPGRGHTTPSTVLVTAPSVENVSHLAREWMASRYLLDPEQKITTAVVLGRSQFVSPSQLSTLLLELDGECPALEEWLQAGMPPGQTPATRFLSDIEPSLCGLMADVEVLVGTSGLRFQDAALDEDSPLAEQEVYRGLREKALTVDIVWTTHAMLCMDNLRLTSSDASALLPAPLALFVDEAHTLESVQASVAAKGLSFLRLMAALRSTKWDLIRKGTAAKNAINKIRSIIGVLSDIPNETPLPIARTGDDKLIAIWDQASPDMAALRLELSGLIKGVDKKLATHPELAQATRYVERSLAALQNLGNDFRGHIEHSPRRGCISFTIGPASVEKHLAARWATTPTAMLLSGTLHYVGATGANYSSVFKEFAVPEDRHYATTPIHPSWVTDTPTVFTPHESIFHRFVPPTGENANELSMASWLHECAGAINLAAQDAAGGMLVLMTGYERLEGLHAALQEAYPALASRLLVQARQSRIASYIPVFKTRARAGERPIWLATGSAWTGLDLADDLVIDAQAAQDIVLTDLVIPNLPFGLHRTTTHVAKVARMGFAAEALATQRLFRQGLGRGIRREGLINRRYWILDGRLQHPAAANYTMDSRRILTGFIHRDTFIV